MIRQTIVAAAAFSAMYVSTNALSAEPPFSGPKDVAFAGSLWKALEQNRLVGADRIQAMPYKTPPPHGQFVESIDGRISVDGRKGVVIVKKNFGKSGKETRQEIADDPDRYMTSITVMFKREAGYDADNKNWYWAKYFPDGSLFKNPKGMALAGRVAKGSDKACIACHIGAPGKDYVFIHDRYAD
jgi:hypothetical protein